MNTRKRKAAVLVDPSSAESPSLVFKLLVYRLNLRKLLILSQSFGENTLYDLEVVLYEINFIHFVIKAHLSEITVTVPSTYTYPKEDTSLTMYFLLTFNHIGVSNFNHPVQRLFLCYLAAYYFSSVSWGNETYVVVLFNLITFEP